MATSRLLLAPVQNAWKAPVSGGWNSVTYTWNKQFPREALSKKCSKKSFTQSSGGVLWKEKMFLKFLQN